jgi:hypothetical protein
LITTHTPPASSSSSSTRSSICSPRVTLGEPVHERVTPFPDCKSQTIHNGFRRHSERCSGGGVNFSGCCCCGFTGSAASSSSLLASASMRMGMLGDSVEGGVKGAFGATGCSLSASVGSSSSPSSGTDIPK